MFSLQLCQTFVCAAQFVSMLNVCHLEGLFLKPSVLFIIVVQFLFSICALKEEICEADGSYQAE